MMKTFGSSVTSGSSPRSSPSPEPPLKKSSPHPLSNPVGHQWGGLDLSMTAAEMRSKIGSRKKRDPRRDDRMDFRKKYEIIETL
ncbi:hypothetical protein TCAL_17328 [Tigriopus californicus]|uniref:Uncharacterized protein n=1 Tax=Tigriopus californicus TaxID=6832 RepID=A0A553P0G8_TIGCA|nr:hypothetical protein TCAL_17328 [Tigriopus californicus]